MENKCVPDSGRASWPLLVRLVCEAMLFQGSQQLRVSRPLRVEGCDQGMLGGVPGDQSHLRSGREQGRV